MNAWTVLDSFTRTDKSLTELVTKGSEFGVRFSDRAGVRVLELSETEARAKYTSQLQYATMTRCLKKSK